MLGSPGGNLLDKNADPLCKLAIRWLLADPYAILRRNTDLAFPRLLLDTRDLNGVDNRVSLCRSVVTEWALELCLIVSFTKLQLIV